MTLSNSPPPLVDARNLRRHVDQIDRPLLDVDRFSIFRGDRIGLSGPTGSGKSTLLRSLVMLDPCDHGELFCDGQRVGDDSVTSYRRQVIYLSQRPALVPGTVRDNLQLPFTHAVSGERFDRSIAIEWLERFDKQASLLDQPAETLSGGERQIVALIRAVQLRPKALLLDEPTAALDDKSAAMFESALMRWYESASLPEQPRAFVLASHRADQIERLTERRIVIQEGRIVSTTEGRGIV